jgi:branched-chain amino acid aminotransferase
MFDENLIVYLNGDFKKLSDSKISPMCHSLHYGSGVFEGIRAYKIKNGTGVLKLKEHIERLFYSAEKIGLEISETREELEQIVLEILKKNNLESAYIRPLVFFDNSSLGITTTNNKTNILIAA